jgi:hypothetical protein
MRASFCLRNLTERRHGLLAEVAFVQFRDAFHGVDLSTGLSSRMRTMRGKRSA